MVRVGKPRFRRISESALRAEPHRFAKAGQAHAQLGLRQRLVGEGVQHPAAPRGGSGHGRGSHLAAHHAEQIAAGEVGVGAFAHAGGLALGQVNFIHGLGAGQVQPAPAPFVVLHQQVAVAAAFGQATEGHPLGAGPLVFQVDFQQGAVGAVHEVHGVGIVEAEVAVGARPAVGNEWVKRGFPQRVDGPYRCHAAVVGAHLHQLVRVRRHEVEVAPLVGCRRNPAHVGPLRGQLPRREAAPAGGRVVAVHQFRGIGGRFGHGVQAVIKPLGQRVRLKGQHLSVNLGRVGQVVARKLVNGAAIVFPLPVAVAGGRNAEHLVVAELVGVAAAWQGLASKFEGVHQCLPGG